MSATVIYNFDAVQGKADALLEVIEKARDFALTVAGCEAFDVYQGQEDPHKFVMIERWASIETHRAHFEKNVKGSGTFDTVLALMAAPPQGTYYLRR